MPTPILATKLYTPSPRPNAVLRPLLMEQLNAGLYRKLTLISAPAGFGKTAVATEWVIHCQHPVAWLSLDDGDNDLNHFLAYLVNALQTILPNIGTAVLEILAGPPPVPTEPLLTTLLNEIAIVPEKFILVLDDYHLIREEPVDQALAFMLDHLPPTMHLAIATREEPNLPLARLRMRDQLTELRVEALRFTDAETAVFLNQSMGLNLSTEEIKLLESRTEGWVAGLQLAALALRGAVQEPQNSHALIQSFTGSHRFVADYLVEELLEQQPNAVQTFLLQTSILERMCGSLCEAVLGEGTASGQSYLEQLERANLLIVPLDNGRYWYRYHHLFADVLRTRLMKEQPEQLAELHRRACRWYEQNHLRSDAIRHALAAEAFEWAADLIELEWSDVRRSCFRSPTWLGWVSGLPPELVQNRPVLCVGYAWQLLNFGEMAAAETQMVAAERWLGETAVSNQPTHRNNMVIANEAERPSLRGILASARAYHAQAMGDVDSTVKYSQYVLEIVAEDDHYTRGITTALLGLAYWTNGNLERAHRSIADGIASLKLAGNILFAINGTLFVADLLAAQGHLRQAITVIEKALRWATEKEPVLQGTANLYLGLSALHYERGERTIASDYLQKSEALSVSAALPDWHYYFYLFQSRMKQAARDWAGALAQLDEAEQHYYMMPVPNVRAIPVLRAQLWLAQNRLDEALAWADAQGLAADGALSYLREFEYVTLARLMMAEGKNAIPLLHRLLKVAQDGGRGRSVLDILLLQTLAHQAQGNILDALSSLQQAVTLAEPEGYVQIFVDEGASIEQLLAQMKRDGGDGQAYVERLLSAFNEDGQPASLPSQLLVEPLSQRELEILQLIAQGLSNRQISERLFLALSTIKGHNRHIFDKLQVKRRTEAVARARELGLL